MILIQNYIWNKHDFIINFNILFAQHTLIFGYMMSVLDQLIC